MDETTLSQQPYLTFFSEDVAEYDVIVDQSSSSPNLKEATWAAIQPLLQLIGPQMGADEMALVLEYSPMPESFLEKLKALQDKKAQQPPPPNPEMLKIDAMKQAKAAELQMKQQEARVNIQVEQERTAAELELERQKTQMQAMLEREKTAAQIELQREKAQAELLMEQQRAAMEQEKSRLQLAFEQQRVGLEQKRQRADMQAREAVGNAELTSAIQQMTQAFAGFAMAQSEANQALAQGMAQMGAELKNALTKPKQIVRGPDGRAVGVQ